MEVPPLTEPLPGLSKKYMTRPELYREACTPREGLDEHFVASLRFRIIQDDPGRWDEERDNHFCLNWCVALRAAIGEAWDSYTEAEFSLKDTSSVTRYAQGWAHGQRYTAMKVIRDIAREMYRETVPQDERVM